MSRRILSFTLPLTLPLCLLLAQPVLPMVSAFAAPAPTQQTKSSSKKNSSSGSKSSSSKSKGKQGAASGSKTSKNSSGKKGTSGSKSASGKSSSGKKSKNSKNRGGASKKTSSSTPQSAAEARRLEEAAQREISDTKRQLQVNDANIKKGVDELGRLQGDIGDAKKKVEAAASEVASLDSRIAGLETEVATEEGQLQKLRDEYLKAIKKMRASGKNNSTLAFVFSSGTFNQALRRMRYLKEFSEWKERQSAEITKKVDHLKKQRDLLSRSRAQKDVALRRQQTAHRELEQQYARQDAIVVELRANGQALNAHLAKKQAEANALRGRISALIAAEEQARRQREEAEARERRRAEEAAEAERAARAREEARLAEEQAAQRDAQKAENASAGKNVASSKTSDKTKVAKGSDKSASANKSTSEKDKKKKDSGRDYADARKRKPRSDSGNAPKKKTEPAPASKSGASKPAASTPAAASGGSFGQMRGSLPRPVSGSFRITSPFGRHALPELPDVVYDNPGIDAQVSPGATAQAVYGGVVSGVYVIPGFSTVVIVNHGSYYTVYGNIASPAVKVDDKVKQGQSLGRLAVDEDDSSHSSIHFEVWHLREKLNPSEWIR